MHKFWGYYATGSGDSDAAVVPWLHSFFHSQFILLFATFCPLKINTITIEIFFFDWFSLLILFNSYLSCFCFFFLSALLLGIPLQNAVSFYGCFCSYFYLCVLGDLTPEGDFEKKVDRSHKKNRKACEARKARITFYWCGCIDFVPKSTIAYTNCYGGPFRVISLHRVHTPHVYTSRYRRSLAVYHEICSCSPCLW